MITVQTLNNKIATYVESNTSETVAMRHARELSKQNPNTGFYVKLNGSTLAIYRNGYML